MPRMTFVVVLLCLAGGAPAQTLYHCRTHGVSSYQQSPCPASSRMVSSMQTIPEPVPTESQRRMRAEQAVQDRAESAFLSHSAGTDAGTANGSKRAHAATHRLPQRSACQDARATRTAALEVVGLKRTYDMLQRLDQTVADACRHG